MEWAEIAAGDLREGDTIRLTVKVDSVGGERHLGRVTLFLSDGGSMWSDVADLYERAVVNDEACTCELYGACVVCCG